MIFAQVQIHNRAGDESCVADNGLCPNWIWDNFDRYVDPFWHHVYLTVLAVAIGFAISFALALLAYHRRWLIGPIVNVTAIMYTIPKTFRRNTGEAGSASVLRLSLIQITEPTRP